MIGKMLIEDYELELFTPPCAPGTEMWAAIARLKVDISEALPYLNATLPGAVYSHAAKGLTWKKGECSTAFHPYKIAAADFEDRSEADKMIQGLVRTVNRIWEKRGEIEPDFKMHRGPAPMAVFKLLPRTNCRQCGQTTCFTFALKVAAGQQKLEDCPPLLEPEFAGPLAQLRVMTIDAPAIG